MPAPVLKSLADRADVSMAKAEEYWDKAKKIAEKEGRSESEGDAFYAYVTGIVKNMMGLKESVERKTFSTYSGALVLFESADQPMLQAGTWDKPYLAKLRGPFMEFDVRNQNDRLYGQDIKAMLQNDPKLRRRIEMRAMVAQGNHPATGLNTDIEKIGGVVTRLDFEGNRILGEVEILNTRVGRDIYELLKAKIPVGVSARGCGEIGSGGRVIAEGYELITFDLVIDPSFETAIPEVQEIMENIRRAYAEPLVEQSKVENIQIDEKNIDGGKPMLFEQFQVKEVKPEDLLFTLKRIIGEGSKDSFNEYFQNYLYECARMYFDNEKLLEVNWRKFWEISQKVTKECTSFELPVLEVTETDVSKAAAAVNSYVKTIITEYNAQVRERKVDLTESLVFKYLGVAHDVCDFMRLYEQGEMVVDEPEGEPPVVVEEPPVDECGTKKTEQEAATDEKPIAEAEVEIEVETGEEDEEEGPAEGEMEIEEQVIAEAGLPGSEKAMAKKMKDKGYKYAVQITTVDGDFGEPLYFKSADEVGPFLRTFPGYQKAKTKWTADLSKELSEQKELDESVKTLMAEYSMPEATARMIVGAGRAMLLEATPEATPEAALKEAVAKKKKVLEAIKENFTKRLALKKQKLTEQKKRKDDSVTLTDIKVEKISETHGRTGRSGRICGKMSVYSQGVEDMLHGEV